MVHVDGSSTLNESGARLILISPKGEKYEYSLRFAFLPTNNKVEYKAITASLDMEDPRGKQISGLS